MKKYLALSAIVVLGGCDMLKKSGDTGEGGATASPDAAASVTTNATAPSIVDKALSFVTGSTPFEGEITMNVSEKGKTMHTITYEVKGTKMRFDAPAENGPMSGGYVIFDSTSKQMQTVSDAKKMAFTIDMNRAPQAAGAGAAAAKKPTIDRTGKMDTVAGYSCEIWKITNDDGSKGEVCVGKGIAFPSFGGRNAEAWMSELNDSFPLRAVMSDATGTEKTRMEVTKIDKKSLDDSKFQVPAGYQTMSMDQMLQGMGGLRRGH